MYNTLWPLPGGAGNYAESLLKILDYIDIYSPNFDGLISWTIETFPKVRSRRFTTNCLRQPINLKFMEKDRSDICTITPTGKQFLETNDKHLIFLALVDNIKAVYDIVNMILDNELIDNEPINYQTIKNEIENKWHFKWQTNQQINWRLCWLLSIGVICENAGKYYITDSGVIEIELYNGYDRNTEMYR